MTEDLSESEGRALWIRKHMRVCGTRKSERYKGTQRRRASGIAVDVFFLSKYTLYRFQGLVSV